MPLSVNIGSNTDGQAMLANAKAKWKEAFIRSSHVLITRRMNNQDIRHIQLLLDSVLQI